MYPLNPPPPVVFSRQFQPYIRIISIFQNQRNPNSPSASASASASALNPFQFPMASRALIEYDRKRLENISRNDEMMAALKLQSKASELSAASKRQRSLSNFSYWFLYPTSFFLCFVCDLFVIPLPELKPNRKWFIRRPNLKSRLR